MTAHPRSARRLIALGLAGGTFAVTATTGLADAQASTTTSSVYQGTADAAAAQLVVTLPAALAGALSAALPNPIDLSIIRSTGLATHDGKSADVASSTSDLAQGSLIDSSALSPALQPLLKRAVTATLATPTPADSVLVPLPSNPLGLALNVGSLTAKSSTSAKSTAATGNVANAALGSLATLAPPLAAALQTIVDQVNAGLATATDQLAALINQASALNPVITQLTSALGSIPLPSTGIPGVPTALPVPTGLSTDTLAATIQAIPSLVTTVTNALLNGAVVNLAAVSSSEGVTPASSGTSSTGATNTGDISLFGGLVTIVASKATATASATGTPGKASAAATATLLQVTLGDKVNQLLNVIADEEGITAQLLPTTALGQQLNAATQGLITGINTGLNAALTALVGLLQQLNSDTKVLNQGTVTKSVTADGRHAEAHATPAKVIVGLPGADNLVALALGQVDVVANRQNVTTTVTAPKAPTAPKTAPKEPTKKLAYTGADLPLTAGVALVLLAGAGALARRRRRTLG